MSGPKSATYRLSDVGGAGIVRDERPQLRAGVATRRTRCEELRQRLKQQLAADPELEDELPAEPGEASGDASAEELRELQRQLDGYLTELQAAFDAQAARLRVQRLQAAVSRSGSDRTAGEPGAPPLDAGAPAQDQIADDAAEKPAPEDVERVLGRLRADVAAEDSERIEALAATLLGEDAGQHAGFRAEELSITALRVAVQRANDEAAEQEAAKEAAEETIARAESTGVGDEELMAELWAAARGEGEWSAALAAKAEAAVEAKQAERVAEEVGERLEDALVEFGYDVTQGFATELVETGVAHAGMPASDEHEVRVRLDPEDGEARFHVVGLRGRRNAADKAVEEAWCGDYAQLQEYLAARGVELTTETAAAPGELPLFEVDALTAPHERRGRRERPAPRAREIGD